MEKIKRFALSAMLIAAICVAAACGRNNDNGTSGSSSAGTSGGTSASMESASSGGGNGSSASGTTNSGIESNSPGNTSSSAGTNSEGESGGVLKDMVDDVKEGIDDMTDGTSAARN
ncbi:MAG: hypothetical protein HFE84_01260 [Lachnospiraceae bacterium]|nr:hypothetical protein [Lachnospiraceae bacterium]